MSRNDSPTVRGSQRAPISVWLDELVAETPALLEKLDTPAPADAPLPQLPLSDIAPDPLQPRRHIRQDSLDTLAADIARVGVLQPLVVRPATDWNGYILVFGERRYRAALQAGLTHVPAIVRRDLDDAAVLELQWQENARREDIDDIDKALHLRRMREVSGQTWSQLAESVHLTRRHLLRMQQLAEMTPFVTTLLREHRLTPSHVYQLARVSDPARQESLARAAVASRWPVSRLSAEIQSALESSASDTPDPADEEPRRGRQRELKQVSPIDSESASEAVSGLTAARNCLRGLLGSPLDAIERVQIAEIAALAARLLESADADLTRGNSGRG